RPEDDPRRGPQALAADAGRGDRRDRPQQRGRRHCRRRRWCFGDLRAVARRRPGRRRHGAARHCRCRSHEAGQAMTPVTLTIAGSDSGGGAGIQADLKTFAALGVYGTSAIAALTAQNTKGVTAIHNVPPDFVVAQIDAVFDDFAVGAVKIGMLSTAPIIRAVAAALERHKAPNIVLDPVMVATSGDRLLAPDAVQALREELI